MVSSILQVEIDNRGCSDMIRQLIGEITKVTAQRRRKPRASPAARPRVAKISLSQLRASPHASLILNLNDIVR